MQREFDFLSINCDTQLSIDSIENVFAEFDYESTRRVLVTYCSGEGCSLSEDLAYELSELFPEQIIYYFEEGYPVWKNLNYPVKAYESVNEEINKPIKKSRNSKRR